jgi:hypothetical protein
MYKSLLEKTRDGMWIAKTSSGRYLGTYISRDLAMQRLWQIDDIAKGAKEIQDRKRLNEERKRAAIRG